MLQYSEDYKGLKVEVAFEKGVTWLKALSVFHCLGYYNSKRKNHLYLSGRGYALVMMISKDQKTKIDNCLYITTDGIFELEAALKKSTWVKDRKEKMAFFYWFKCKFLKKAPPIEQTTIPLSELLAKAKPDNKDPDNKYKVITELKEQISNNDHKIDQLPSELKAAQQMTVKYREKLAEIDEKNALIARLQKEQAEDRDMIRKLTMRLLKEDNDA